MDTVNVDDGAGRDQATAAAHLHDKRSVAQQLGHIAAPRFERCEDELGKAVVFHPERG